MALTRSVAARRDAIRGTAPVEVRKATAAEYLRPGVLPGGVTPLVTGTAGMAYSVGAAGFVTSRGTADGYHLFTNDAPETVGTTGVGSTVPAAPSTGLKRIDIIWVRHPAAGENADGTSQPVFGVTSGTAASAPQPPTIPVGALELARNEMSAGVGSTAASGNVITQRAPFTAVRGATVLVRNQAEMEALNPLVAGAGVLSVWRDDLKVSMENFGTGWLRPPMPEDPTAFMYYRNAAFSVGTGVTVVDFDTAQGVAPTVGSISGGVWTCGATGMYQVSARAGFVSNAAAFDAAITLQISFDGGASWLDLYLGDAVTAAGISGNRQLGISFARLIPASSGNKFRVQITHSGASTAGVPGYQHTWITGHRI